MKKVNATTTVLIMSVIGLTIGSCKENKKEVTEDTVPSEMQHESSSASHAMMENNTQASTAKQVLAAYMTLKEALVATNREEAVKACQELESSLNNLNISSYAEEQQKALKAIVVDAKELASQISKSEIDQQREHFKPLSEHMIAMVAITGTEQTLYQQFCPMFDGGSAWLSMRKDIENPYYGSKMLTCGKVQKEIN